MKLTIISILLLINTSCKNSNHNNDENIVTMGDKISQPRLYNAQEINIIVSICDALKYKRLHFPYDFWNRTFQFQLQSHDCDPSESFSKIYELKFTEETLYSPDGDYPFRDLQTDQQGFMKDLCTAYKESLVSSSPFEPFNTKSVFPGTLRQILFSKKDEHHKIYAIFGQLNVDEVHEFFVKTSSNHSPSLKGFISTINHYERCPNGSSFALTTSTYFD